MKSNYFFKCLKTMWTDNCYFYEIHQLPRYYPDMKLAYIPINKVACTSIKSTLKKEVMSLGDEDLSQRILFEGVDVDDYFIFSFVRNPFERLVSCYKHKIVSSKSDLGSYFLGYLSRSTSFANFVSRLRWLPKSLHNSHFASQYHSIYKRKFGGQRVTARQPDFIGHFERLEQDWEIIRQKYPLPALPHRNATPVDDWRDYYDLKTVDLVYKLYQKDIHAFGYEEEYRKLRDYCRKRDAKRGSA